MRGAGTDAVAVRMCCGARPRSVARCVRRAVAVPWALMGGLGGGDGTMGLGARA